MIGEPHLVRLYVLKLQAERSFSLDNLVVPSSEAPNLPSIGDHQHGLIFWQSVIDMISQNNQPAYDPYGPSLPSIPLRKLRCSAFLAFVAIDCTSYRIRLIIEASS